MDKSVFNIEFQQKDLSSKIVVGLERISEVFKVLLWQHAKNMGLSPIQIQILIFVSNHKKEMGTISHLAKEFNITKPTVSDAVKALEKKGYIQKDHSASDSRSYTISLSRSGKKIVAQTENFASPIQKQLNQMDTDNLEQLFSTLSQLIHQMNKHGILSVQRTCYACSYYEATKNKKYCNLLQKELMDADIRLDCPEFHES